MILENPYISQASQTNIKVFLIFNLLSDLPLSEICKIAKTKQEQNFTLYTLES